MFILKSRTIRRSLLNKILALGPSQWLTIYIMLFNPGLIQKKYKNDLVLFRAASVLGGDIHCS